MNERILIFDGTNTFLRNYAVSPEMDVNGTPIGGLVGTIKSVKFMIRETNPHKVFFVWDAEGGSMKRRGIFSEYKAGRRVRLNREFEDGSVEESRQNVEWQMTKAKELIKLLGVIQVEVPNIEADDAIGYLCGYFESTPKVIVSSDRDMWQLVGPRTAVYWPTKKKFITAGTFKEHSECLPENYVLMRAIEGRGDNADNIKGVKGLGEKTILKLFPQLKEGPVSLEELLDFCRQNAGDTKGPKRWYKVVLDHQDLVKQNIELMQLRSPVISGNSASIIRNAAESVPQFSFTQLKLGFINNGIQVSDADLIPTFKAYQARWEAHARK